MGGFKKHVFHFHANFPSVNSVCRWKNFIYFRFLCMRQLSSLSVHPFFAFACSAGFFARLSTVVPVHHQSFAALSFFIFFSVGFCFLSDASATIALRTGRGRVRWRRITIITVWHANAHRDSTTHIQCVGVFSSRFIFVLRVVAAQTSVINHNINF